MQASMLARMAHPLVLLPALAAAVAAMLVCGACLALGAIAFKWALAGRVAPGIHRCFDQPCSFAPAPPLQA